MELIEVQLQAYVLLHHVVHCYTVSMCFLHMGYIFVHIMHCDDELQTLEMKMGFWIFIQ